MFEYIGETSKSVFERGWEHVNDMATLNKKSHMLKHVIMNHPGEDMGNVKFGMKVLKFCQTSFERQVLEAVTIQKERNNVYMRKRGSTSNKGKPTVLRKARSLRRPRNLNVDFRPTPGQAFR